MKPVTFKGANYVLKNKMGETPMYRNNKGYVLTCWKLSFFERLRIFLTGNLWNLQITDNKPVQGISFTTKKSEFFSAKQPEVEQSVKKSNLKKVA